MIAAWFPFSLSGFGVIEGSWAGSLVMFAGMEIGSAVSVGFFIHCCQVFMTALLGLLGFVLLTPPSQRASDVRLQPDSETGVPLLGIVSPVW